jgi:hypothetical protein
VHRLKYFPKKDWEGKLREALIGWMGMLVDGRRALDSRTTRLSVWSLAEVPLVDFTALERQQSNGVANTLNLRGICVTIVLPYLSLPVELSEIVINFRSQFDTCFFKTVE